LTLGAAFTMICPRCSAEIKIFSPEWQKQRELSSRSCPECKGEVEILWDGTRFAAWLFATVAVVGGLMIVVGVAWPLALFLAFMLGALVAMVPSMVMSVPLAEGTGIRATLYRPRALPPWLSQKWLRALGRILGAVVSVLVITVLISAYIPSPWSGMLLSVLGAFGLWKRAFILPWLQLKGSLAQASSGALVVIGIAICVHSYT
jgi:hypothetical protein